MEHWTPSPAEVVVWILCAVFVIYIVIKTWPFFSKFVKSVDLVVSLPDKLDAINSRFDDQDKTLEDVKRMVTENHHENEDPTLPDRITDVYHLVKESEARAQQRWNEHLAYSATIAERVVALETRFENAKGRPEDQ